MHTDDQLRLMQSNNPLAIHPALFGPGFCDLRGGGRTLSALVFLKKTLDLTQRLLYYHTNTARRLWSEFLIDLQVLRFIH